MTNDMNTDGILEDDEPFAGSLHAAHSAQAILARNVRYWRARREMTQQQLADAAETTREKISDLERGVWNSKLDTIQRVAASLKVSISTLLQ